MAFHQSSNLNVERSTLNVQRSMAAAMKPKVARIENRAGVIDLLAHDTKADEVLLVMNEPRAWDGADARLRELQERFNAYVSFLLDGEFAESHPELAQKRARIEVRCAHMPLARAIELLGQIREQLAHQEIDVQVVVKEAA